jgi:hypothetical protein
MLHQLCKFFHESLFRQLHGFIEPGLHPPAFLRKEFRIQPTQIVWGLHGWEVVLQHKQSQQ